MKLKHLRWWPLGLVVLGILWFVPWVPVLHLGLLAYFPYNPDGKTRYLRLTGPLTSLAHDEWTSSSQIPKSCKASLVAAEDGLFFDHSGIDVQALKKAFEESQKSYPHKKRTIRGGSTITQQLVKNAFLSRKRSYLRKAREIVGALLLNAIMSKDQQLAWYFNVVEFGPRVYGVRAASQFYFHKEPESLLPQQCAALVALLPSPNKWNKSLVAKSYTPFFASRVNTILSRSHQMPMRATRPGETPPPVLLDPGPNTVSESELELMDEEELEATQEADEEESAPP